MSATLEKYPWLRDIVTPARLTAEGSDLTPSVAGLCWWLFSRIDAEDCDAFMARLRDGQNLAKGDPVYELRQAIARTRAGGTIGSRSPTYLTAITIKAWNAYRRGDQVSVISYRPGGAHPEGIPRARASARSMMSGITAAVSITAAVRILDVGGARLTFGMLEQIDPAGVELKSRRSAGSGRPAPTPHIPKPSARRPADGSAAPSPGRCCPCPSWPPRSPTATRRLPRTAPRGATTCSASTRPDARVGHRRLPGTGQRCR